MSEKRNSSDESARLHEHQPGVGARHKPTPTPARGGGYQQNCTDLKFSEQKTAAKKNRDPRLSELRNIGVKKVWLDVAEEIGVDAFLAMWRILDADDSSRHKEGFLQVHLKLYRSFARYQRNRYIEALAAQGLKPPDVQMRLVRQLREQVSLRHISRLACARQGE